MQFFPRAVEIVVENSPALPVWALTGKEQGTGQLEFVGWRRMRMRTVLLRGL